MNKLSEIMGMFWHWYYTQKFEVLLRSKDGMKSVAKVTAIPVLNGLNKPVAMKVTSVQHGIFTENIIRQINTNMSIREFENFYQRYN